MADAVSGRVSDPATDLLTLEVERVAHGGICVARHEGRVVFVRHALPGETVRVAITDDVAGRSYLRGDAVEVLVASPDRVPAPCPHSGPARCGGCDWQHVSLSAQRVLKASVVREQLNRMAGLDWPVVVEEIPAAAEGAGEGLGWRTRVTYAVDAKGVVGLRRARSKEVEPIDRCLIAHNRVDETGVTRTVWPGTAAIEVIAATGSGDRALVIEPLSRGAAPVVPPLPVDTAVLSTDRKGRTQAVRGRPGVRERAVGRTWRVSGSGFWQVHPSAAETLSAAVIDALEPRGGEYALDLYCGVGLFAGALAPVLGAGGRITAVEADPVAAEDAVHNLRDVEPQVRVESGRVEHILNRSGIRQADLVVLDPPRTGAGAVVTRWIASLRPRAIAYVACDPAALGRDLATFAAESYRVRTLRAFDLFPMTHHVECVVALEPVP